jgi:hypothetical protein
MGQNHGKVAGLPLESLLRVSHFQLKVFLHWDRLLHMSVSVGYTTNDRYVATRESDNQLIDFIPLASVLVPESIVNIATPVIPSDVLYNGNCICIAFLTKEVYCSAGYGMLFSVKVPWLEPTISSYPLGSSTTFICVGGGYETYSRFVAIRELVINSLASHFL